MFYALVARLIILVASVLLATYAFDRAENAGLVHELHPTVRLGLMLGMATGIYFLAVALFIGKKK